jgi:methionine synthase II (cobalamin-independent)
LAQRVLAGSAMPGASVIPDHCVPHAPFVPPLIALLATPFVDFRQQHVAFRFGHTNDPDCVVLETLPEKKIILGVLDLSTHELESAETVATRIRRALPHCPADRIIVAPDCGLKYMPRASALGKIKAMVAGAAIVRNELS